jgi:hypothetical protein
VAPWELHAAEIEKRSGTRKLNIENARRYSFGFVAG